MSLMTVGEGLAETLEFLGAPDALTAQARRSAAGGTDE